MRSFILVGTLLLLLSGCAVSAGNAVDAGESDIDQASVADAVARFRERMPHTAAYFDDAYGYAILPSVTRAGLGVGGAYGRGIVVEGDATIGTTGFWQFTSGIQGGVKNFSMIIFFRDKGALDYFKAEQIQFLGQAGIDLATFGAAGTPAYNEGVAIMTMTRFGLMGEFTISGARFTFRPLDDGY